MRRFSYIHQYPDWPQFTWDAAKLAPLLAEVRFAQGRLLGRMASLGFPVQQEASLVTLSHDVVETSAIEGESLRYLHARSSLARRMGLDVAGLPAPDRNVEGISEVMLDATRNYAAPLSRTRLWKWHTALFQGGGGAARALKIGAWRDDATGPMQVVSGGYGREKVHYEAPAHTRLPNEMAAFLQWCKQPSPDDLVLRAALAHFWFVTIHPFDDGNGRIARAIADLFLARSEQSPQRFYSMSAQIQRERAAYYEILEQSQKSSLDITRWMTWFLQCLQRAIAASDKTLEAVLAKSHFWKANEGQVFNPRQHAMLNKMLDGFEGNVTSSKWAKLTKCSHDTALRDLNDLVDRSILSKADAGGRSTAYLLRSPS